MNRCRWFGVVALLYGWCVWKTDCSQAAEPLPRAACVVLADQRTAEPVTAIAAEYQRRTEVSVTVRAVATEDLENRLKDGNGEADIVVGMDTKDGDATRVSKLPDAHTVAWKYPSGEAVWAAPLSSKPDADSIVKFLGGRTGHILWSESAAGFTIVGGPHHAEAYQWVVEHRTAHTYAISAVRMLRECGSIRTGVCLDIGCGSGRLDVELAKRSQLKIVGLDIAEDVQPLFEKTVRDAGFANRITFRQGDAQELPFPDDYADLVVSRGTLPFIPDLGKCLREVDRVLKPTGVAILGGRYVFTPQQHKLSTEELQKIVKATGIAGASVVEGRGQWVKIVGPQAPEAARTFAGGPDMLAGRIVADYAIIAGKALLIHGGDGGLDQALQRGMVEWTELEITALYPKEEIAEQARQRLQKEKLAHRIACRAGGIEQLPFEAESFDLVADVGPVLIWTDRSKAMRELYRVLRRGGVALVGGQYRHMPEFRRVSSETLRQDAASTGIQAIRVIDDMGQWVEIRKGIAAEK
ncbi:MAG TPA: class I SAM-dependent methyltransferase [Candidatus Anammoximicrobium sp.]|nr:class I SAM-dependent methyltransferase [Candidatus Anammoximicrobium sp.]